MTPTEHALAMRQSLQMCTSHLAGPVVAYHRAAEELSNDELREVGALIVERSKARLGLLVDLYGHGEEDREVRRERLTIEFAQALFGVWA